MATAGVSETAESTGSRKYLFATLRLGMATFIIVAIIATFLDTASRTTINPFNFFGYFTMQSNIITVVVLLIAAVATLAGRSQTSLLQLARACATTYIVIVGIFYALLLSGVEGGGGVELEWANWALHVAFPIYAALDWILFADREPIAWKRLWTILIYPVIWIIVVLVRGATDGWVPYPFLDPTTGYLSVAIYATVIFIATVVVGAVVFAISRVRIIKP
jgi:hypothetical protein